MQSPSRVVAMTRSRGGGKAYSAFASFSLLNTALTSIFSSWVFGFGTPNTSAGSKQTDEERW